MDDIRIRKLGAYDEASIVEAGFLFDEEPKLGATRRFLEEATHHILIAYDSKERPVGFVTGVELTHPDLGTEMFLYQLGVAEPARRQGVGRSLVAALKVLAEELSCYGMWVLTETDNVAAQRTYERLSGSPSVARAYEWKFTKKNVR